MDYFSTLKEFSEFTTKYFDKILSWKFLSFIGLFLLSLYSINLFPSVCDKLNPMYNFIQSFLYWILFIFIVCLIYKILYQATEKYYINKKQLKEETETLSKILTLSNMEILRLFYMLKNPTFTAYFPEDDLFILKLKQNGFITSIDGSRKFNDQHLSLDRSNFVIAFCFSKEFLPIIQKYKNKIILSWKNKNLENKKKTFKFFDECQN